MNQVSTYFIILITGTVFHFNAGEICQDSFENETGRHQEKLLAFFLLTKQDNNIVQHFSKDDVVLLSSLLRIKNSYRMSEHLMFTLRKPYEKRGLRVSINLTQRSGIYSNGLRSRALILKYMVVGCEGGSDTGKYHVSQSVTLFLA